MERRGEEPKLRRNLTYLTCSAAICVAILRGALDTQISAQNRLELTPTPVKTANTEPLPTWTHNDIRPLYLPYIAYLANH